MSDAAGLPVPVIADEDRKVPADYNVRDAAKKHKRLNTSLKTNWSETVHLYWMAHQELAKPGRPTGEEQERRTKGEIVTFEDYCSTVGGFTPTHIRRILKRYDPDTGELAPPEERGSVSASEEDREAEPAGESARVEDADGQAPRIDKLKGLEADVPLGTIQRILKAVHSQLTYAGEAFDELPGNQLPISAIRLREGLAAMSDQLGSWLPGKLLSCPRCSGAGTVDQDGRDIQCDVCFGGRVGKYRGMSDN